ncbi:MAG: cytochrome c biogenesis CcdA family protein, partial [Bacillota bacterium]|nr:cytochrome c biogenesis CcdA family protein [Bacillota bacterium]
FLGGILTSLGPCNLSMIPLLVAYTTGQREAAGWKGFWVGVSFTLGTSVTFTALGLAAALLGGLLGFSRTVLYYLAAAVSILAGLHLAGLVQVSLPSPGLQSLRRFPAAGPAGAFFLGLLLGVAGSQCATPVLLAILTLVMARGKLAFGTGLLFAYGLGRGAPLILAATFTAVLKQMPLISRWTPWLEKAAGLVLLGFGLYYAWSA